MRDFLRTRAKPVAACALVGVALLGALPLTPQLVSEAQRISISELPSELKGQLTIAATKRQVKTSRAPGYKGIDTVYHVENSIRYHATARVRLKLDNAESSLWTDSACLGKPGCLAYVYVDDQPELSSPTYEGGGTETAEGVGCVRPTRTGECIEKFRVTETWTYRSDAQPYKPNRFLLVIVRVGTRASYSLHNLPFYVQPLRAIGSREVKVSQPCPECQRDMSESIDRKSAFFTDFYPGKSDEEKGLYEWSEKLAGTLDHKAAVIQGRGFFQGSEDNGTTIKETTITWSFGEEDVTIKIVNPQSDSDQIFKDGKLVIEPTARVEPAKYAKEVEWEIEDIQGSNKTIEPERGDKAKITFDGLPEENSQFGEKKITARVRGKQDQVTVKVFFKRDGEDNPGEKSRSPQTGKAVKEPNWLYYWKQTSAAGGRASAILYGKGAKDCDKDTFGFYDKRDDLIYICERARLNSTNKIIKKYTDGIDTFAVTVLHEWKHKTNYDQWWRSRWGYYVPSKDLDGDDIPDSEEPGLNPKMDPKMYSSHPYQRGVGDEHYFAWIEEGKWRNGAADKEDWACPGKQCGRK